MAIRDTFLYSRMYQHRSYNVELVTEQAKESKIGSERFVLAVGQQLKIETSPEGEEVLNFTADKNYVVYLNVHLTQE